MKKDCTKAFLDSYFNSSQKLVEIRKKNGEIIKGRICGFVKGDALFNDTYIIRWHIIQENVSESFGSDVWGFHEGVFIAQKDIHTISIIGTKMTYYMDE